LKEEGFFMQSVDTHNPSLLNSLLDLLADFRPAFSQERVFQRAGSLVLASAASFARKTMTQLLTSLGQVQKDWSASYRLLSFGRFDAQAVANLTLKATLPHVGIDQPYAVVFDATHVSRSSHKMPGTFWTRCPRTAPWARGFERRQRFENVCWLTPLEEGYRRAIPLKWQHVPSPKAIASADASCLEWEAGLQGIQWVRSQLDTAGRTAQRLLAFADGSYDVNKMWAALPANTTLVVRCAKNRKLRCLPPTDQPIRPGARCKYGECLPSPEAMRHEPATWQKLLLPVRDRTIQMKCRVVGPLLAEGAPNQPLFLLLVKGYHRRGAGWQKRRPPCQYLVNAIWEGGQWCLPLPLVDLIGGTWHRWEVEVCHREIKTSFGLGQMQCWSKLGSTLSVSFMAWCYSTLVLAGYKAWGGLLGGPKRRQRWWPGALRWSFGTLLQGYRQALWGLNQFYPVCTVIPIKGQIIRPDWGLALNNAAWGCLRG
jgi:hypothetical protein